LRLDDVEAALIPLLQSYITEVYPDHRDKPLPSLIVLDDVQFKRALKVRDSKKSSVKSAYGILENIEQLQDERVFREYEERCRLVADREAHRLSG